MNPLISVVMPVYNAEKYLREAIDSILNQTFKDFEFIIINDGSTDSSLEIIKEYQNQDDRIILISRENKGLIASLNEGIAKAKGKYIARMDADDISLPNRFKQQIELMEKELADICGGHYFIMNENMSYIDVFIAPLSPESFMIYMANTVPFAHPSVMIKKDFLVKHSLSYGSSGYKDAEDYALWIDMWNNKAKFVNIDDFILKYREVPTSLSKLNSKNLYDDVIVISKEFIEMNKVSLMKYFENNNLKTKSLKEQYLISIIIFYIFKKDYNIKAFRILKKLAKRQVLFGLITFFSKKY